MTTSRTQGDTWLSSNLPTILNSPEYTSGSTAVFITWDEGSGGSTGAQITATDSAPGQTLTYTATGLPAGLSISPTTGLISGTPTTTGTFTVTVTVTDTTGAHGSATFSWRIRRR